MTIEIETKSTVDWIVSVPGFEERRDDNVIAYRLLCLALFAR